MLSRARRTPVIAPRRDHRGYGVVVPLGYRLLLGAEWERTAPVLYSPSVSAWEHENT